VQEPRAEMFLELRDVARRHRARHVEGIGGPGEGAQFRHPREDAHSEQLVHDAGL